MGSFSSPDRFEFLGSDVKLKPPTAQVTPWERLQQVPRVVEYLRPGMSLAILKRMAER